VASWKIKEAIRLIFGKADPGGAYLDCFLIHFPGRGNPLGAWDALREARDEGLLKHIGVSNFEIRHLQELRNYCGEYPELNQIEFHPFIYSKQRNLLEFCRENRIAVEGYCPMAQGLVIRDPVVGRIAEAHREIPARIALQWAMQHGVLPIVGSRNADHIRANAARYAFSLTRDEMHELNQIGARHSERISLRWNWDPTTAPLGSADWR